MPLNSARPTHDPRCATTRRASLPVDYDRCVVNTDLASVVARLRSINRHAWLRQQIDSTKSPRSPQLLQPSTDPGDSRSPAVRSSDRRQPFGEWGNYLTSFMTVDARFHTA
jgi:hypothetical protein